MKDTFGREIDYLRIAVTDRYAYNKDEKPAGGRELTCAEIVNTVVAAQKLGIKRIRLVGGEPLLREDLEDIIKGIKAVEGIEELSLTTDATLMDGRAMKLKKAGLDRVNVNLDSLDPTTYAAVTGGGKTTDLANGLAAIDEAGLPMKWNVTALRGLNDDEILSFAQITLNEKIEVRFIELTPGSRSGVGEKEFMSGEEVKEHLGGVWMLPYEGGNTRHAKYMGAKSKIGFITPVTEKFCESCNKICITAAGKLKTCICAEPEADLLPLMETGGEALTEAIRQGIQAKKESSDI